MERTVTFFGILLLPVVMGQNSLIVKKSDAELYDHKVVFPDEKNVQTYGPSHKVKLIIDVNSLSNSQIKTNEKKKHKRERLRKRKDKGGKFSRQKNKSQKGLESFDKHTQRNNEKVNLVRNKTIEILKNGLRILSAEKSFHQNGNKPVSRVNETLLEKILSSAVSKQELVSATGYKVPVGVGVYENIRVTEKALIPTSEESFKKNKKQNATDDFEYEYDLLGDVQMNVTRPYDNIDYENVDQTVGTLLEQIVNVLKNWTGCSNGSCPDSHETFEDPCQKWLSCRESLDRAFTGDGNNLPSCPCTYPSSIFYDDNIWDKKHKKFFRWRDASSESERLDIYKPGATYCIRSLLTQGSLSVSSQQCCYDRSLRLITRGSGAGTINFISPDVSRKLHYTVDILPWRLCKGDFTRYNTARNPNNGNSCPENPDEEQYLLQVKLSKIF